MPSSLAAQLAKSTSLNTSLLSERARRKPTQSYLFTSREADQHDLDSIHALGVNGLTQLALIEPTLNSYESQLFSDAAKSTDRTLLPKEEDAALGSAIDEFLPLLGPFLLESPTGKVIEWLVRRFRIHEFNVKAVLALFLPYHEAPHFTKMLSILHIDENTTFAPLLPYKTTTTELSRQALVNLILHSSNVDFARFVASILTSALRLESIGGVHRGLIAFHTSVLLAFIKESHERRKGNVPDESTLAWLLPAAVEPLQLASSKTVSPSKSHLLKETILSSYLLLTALSHTCPLTEEAMSAIVAVISSCVPRVSTKHVVRTIVAFLAPQDNYTSRALSASVSKKLLAADHLVEELIDSLQYSGSERFISSLLSTLLSRRRLADEESVAVVNAFLTTPELPDSVVGSLTAALAHALTEEEDGDAADQKETINAHIRSLLVQVQQRYPAVLRQTFESISKDESKKEVLERALLSLSMDIPNFSGDSNDKPVDSIVASLSSDPTVRAVAVRDLYVKLQAVDVDAAELESTKSALLSRVQDPNATVVDALYANTTQLLPLVLADVKAYVDNVISVLRPESSPNRLLIKSHLTFISQHLYPALSSLNTVAELSNRIFYELFLPFLLYTKPRQKTAAAVWELLEATEKIDDTTSGFARYELLSGCVDAVRWEEGASAEGSKEQNIATMTKVNLAIANRIAENIVSSNSFAEHVAAFLSALQDSDPHTRGLAYLVVRALIHKLTGEHQLSVAQQLIEAMKIDNLSDMGEIMKGAENLQAILDDANLGHAVYQKPSSRNTLYRLQASLLMILSNIQPPSGVILNWLNEVKTSITPGVDARGPNYMLLLRNLYKVVNSTAGLPLLSGYVIRNMFMNLGNDALKFLASIWLSADLDVPAEPQHFVALHHAAAFMEAHLATNQWIDFQTVLPTILVALQHTDRRVRGAALDCLTALVKMSEHKPAAVYAYDEIYGSSSASLQYLDWSDFSKYVKELGESSDHLLQDKSYLRILQQQLLVPGANERKKDVAYKKRVLCYILSHVNACPLPVVRQTLLESVAAVSSPVKAEVLLPTIQALVDNLAGPNIVPKFGDRYESFATLVVSTFDRAASDCLNQADGTAWSAFEQAILYFFRSSSHSGPRKAIAQQIRSGLFVGLNLERKIEVCQLLLGLGQQIPEMTKECKEILLAVIADVTVIISLLVILQPGSSEVIQRASKRAKTDGVAETDDIDKTASMNLFADVLAAASLPGSSDLLVSLLDTLTKVVHDNTPTGDKMYTEQLLMSAMENVANNMPADTRLSPATIRLDILVELIRVSENPQTFNQALLLMATLARLAPDAVLLNIMPIFTFMGSNVFHRDDSYSFRVVQKTIDSIVPVMVSSLKVDHSDRLGLYTAARPFLRIFTDAANHIPRHRRTAFFTQLTEALGADEFLPPVSMLLVDKISTRVVRQSPADARNSLTLVLNLLHRYPTTLQLTSLIEVLHESQRLVKAGSDLSLKNQTFLELSPDDEPQEQSSILHRQAQALLVFVGAALEGVPPISNDTTGQQLSSQLLSLALDLAISNGGDANIAKAALSVVRNTLAILSAANFINGVVTVIQSGDVAVQQGALELVGENLSEVKDTTRAEMAKTVVKLVGSIKTILSSQPAEPLIVASCHALNAITLTMSPGEEASLTETVPLVVKLIKERKCIGSTLEVLLSLVTKLGPRIIPSFKDIVGTCVGVFRLGDIPLIHVTHAIGVLHALLSSIPKFWGNAELLQVVDLYLESGSSVSQSYVPQMTTLIRALAKKAPSKTLLPLLCEKWNSLTGNGELSLDKLSSYFSVFKRAIRAAPRPAISDHLRLLFKTFLDAFQLCATKPDVREQVESEAIATFLELIMKINEVTFKPLFRKLFDWAFNSEEKSADDTHKLVFCHIYISLLDYFKGLMTPYMSFLLQPLTTLLMTFSKASEFSDTEEELWLAVVNTLYKTFIHDEGVFWREDRLRQILSPLVAQIAVCPRLDRPEAKEALSGCLSSMAEITSDDSLLKSLNLDILMHTRSEDSRVRLYALSCSEAIWRNHGGKLLGLVPETTTFIAEAVEDENDTVVREAHRLKEAVESVAGRIDA
ncbi:hypothetical protein K474DRAFT_1669523 [Panus rudis PR-1116 ss-1]|nr:hypothetical protein K474DRAFT_1669523 [Panus rudis PR-1116 ss-1]